MAEDTLALLKSKLPVLFAAATGALQQRAAAGDADARRRLSALDAPAAALVVLRGTGQGAELHLTSARGALEIAGAPAGSGVFGHALALPEAAARYGLTQLAQGGPEIAQLVRAWAALISADARDLFAAVGYAFELEVRRVPVLGDVRATISLGRPQLPDRAEFTLGIDYDDLEDAREAQVEPQQLFLAGKVGIDGDVAKAMMLGMTLAQLR
jgi:hypothetical protein